ncbi:riboflavin kinase/FAD synthetase domain protein [Leptospira interrogans serovar Bataviae str. HAI135]|nr:riboflavin kinase/FAD synthetase domain protein [Leptospira interrogans serovar Bataviae str. HAI135]
MRVYFKEKIRDEIKFSSVETLISQLKQDEVIARNILKSTIGKNSTHF